MAASQEQKVDFLLKKIGYTASKSGIAEDSGLSGTKKAPFAEPIPSPLAVADSSVWAQANNIPATPPTSATDFVGIYTAGSSGFRMTVDNTVSGNRTFIARSSWAIDSSSNTGDWIDTQFGSDYIIKVWKGDPNSGGVQLSAAGSGSNDTWFFDYSSGILNFNGDAVPSGITTSNIYVTGYRYTGIKGAIAPGAAATVTDFHASGVSTFAGLIDANARLDVVGGANIDQLNVTGVSTIGNVLIGGGTTDLLVNGDARITGVITSGTDSITINGPTGIIALTGIVATGVVTGVTGTFSGDISAANFTSSDSEGGGYSGVGATFNNLAISGISTFEGAIDANGTLDVDGDTQLDDLTVAGVSTFSNKVIVQNNNEFWVGTSGDIQLHHNASTGMPRISGNKLRIQSVTGAEDYIAADVGAGVSIYYDDSLKFQTVGGGVSIANGVSTTATLYGPENIIIDPHPIGVGTTSGTVRIKGDLYVEGTQFVVDSDHIHLGDFVVGIATTVASEALTDGAGIGIGSIGHEKTFLYEYNGGTNPSLKASENLNVASGKAYQIAETEVLNATTLGSGVVNSSLTSVGTLSAVTVSGDITANGNIAGDSSTNITGINGITAAGDITANGNIVGDNSTNISGISSVTATTYYGSGANLTGITIGVPGINTEGTSSLQDLTVAGVATFSGNVQVGTGITMYANTGIVSAVAFYGDGENLSNTIRQKLEGLRILNEGSFVGTGYTVALLNFVGDNVTASLTGIGSTATITYSDYPTYGSLTVSGFSTFSNKINAGGDLDVDGTTDLDVLNVAELATFTGAIDANDTTQSASSTTGSATFAGGVGIAKNLFVGGGTQITGITTFSSAVLVATNQTLQFANANHAIVSDGSDLDINVSGSNDLLLRVNASGGSAQDVKLQTGTTDVLVAKGHSAVDITGTLNVTGVTTFSSAIDANGTLDVDGDTQLDDLNVSGVATFSNTANFDVVSITGSSTFTGNVLDFGEAKQLRFGTGNDFAIQHSTHTLLENDTAGGNLTINNKSTSGKIILNVSDNENALVANPDGSVEIYHDDAKKFETTSTGSIVTGIITATTFSGALSGNATSATTATNITVSANNSTDETVYPIFVDGATGGQGAESDTGLTYNPSSGVFSATSFAGSGANLTGVGTQGGDIEAATLTVTGISTFYNDVKIVGGGSTAGNQITIGATTLNNGTLTFDGTEGQLFSISNNLTDGSIFSVNDVSGMPSIDVGAAGTIQLAPYGASEMVGIGTTRPTSKLDVVGDVQVVGVVTATSFSGNGSALTNVTATNATNSEHVYVTDNESTSENNLVTFVENAQDSSGNHGLEMDGNFTYNPSSGTVTATVFSGSGASLTSITNSNLSGSAGITNANLANSTVSYGGVSLALGASDATPAFDLSDATSIPAGELTGTIAAARYGTGNMLVKARSTSAASDSGSNVFAGPNAGAALNGSSGDHCTFFGLSAGQNNDGGQNNTFLGSNAGNSNVSGHENTAIGQEAFKNGSGDANVVIGRRAAITGSFTGDNNIIIGHDAEPTAAATSNEITLGDSNINLFRIPGFSFSVGTGGASISGIVTATTLDISGNADIDGTCEADAYTVDGTALSTYIAGITVTNATNATSATTATTATTATNATHVTVTDNESTNEDNLIAFVEDAQSSTGNHGLEMDGNFTYNPSSGTVTATVFSGSGASLTALNGSNIASGTVAAARVATLNQDTTGTADNITVSANNSTDETVYPIFVDGATGSQGAESDTGLTYNPNSGNLTATKFTGDGSALTGIEAGGTGDFYVGFTSSVTMNANSYETTGHTFASTAGKTYTIDSIMASNVAEVGIGTTVNLIASISSNSGVAAGTTEQTYIAYNIPIAAGGAIELIKEPIVANPNDIVKLWATNDAYVGVASAIQVYMTYTQQDSTDFFGKYASTVSLASTSITGIYTAGDSVSSTIQSIHLTNRSDAGAYPVDIMFTNNTGVSTTYLVKNLVVPKYSSVEILERPKRMEIGSSLGVKVHQTGTIDVVVSGKKYSS